PELSTEEPLYAEVSEEHGVPLSPSQLESFWACPLHGILSRLGAGRPSTAASAGTSLHRYFEQLAQPHTVEELDALRKHFEEHWQDEAFESPWLAELNKDANRVMLERIIDYSRASEVAGTTVLGTEVSFSLRAGDAELRGVIDRIERAPDGAVMIVDLKTGATAPATPGKLSDNIQLKNYQLALLNGAVEEVDPQQLAGAKLLVVSPRAVSEGKPAAQPVQPRLDDTEAQELMTAIAETAEELQGPVYLAALDEHCLDQYGFGHCRIHVI